MCGGSVQPSAKRRRGGGGGGGAADGKDNVFVCHSRRESKWGNAGERSSELAAAQRISPRTRGDPELRFAVESCVIFLGFLEHSWPAPSLLPRKKALSWG